MAIIGVGRDFRFSDKCFLLSLLILFIRPLSFALRGNVYAQRLSFA